MERHFKRSEFVHCAHVHEFFFFFETDMRLKSVYFYSSADYSQSFLSFFIVQF